jgi:N-methylhydantoinase B
VQRLRTGKTVEHVALDVGDGFLVEVGGGGGFWDPLERDPERVLADVRSGYVSLEAASHDYGVVIHQNGRKFELDVIATQRLRELRSAPKPQPKDRNISRKDAKAQR